MNTTSITLVLVFISLPFVVYLSVKLGTYAFFRGRKLFHDEYGDKDE